MEKFILAELNEDYAKEICNWRYEGNYSVYNFSDWDVVVENKLGFSVKEIRELEFLAILFNNELIAYGRIVLNRGKSFIGIGLKPSWCGQGYGKNVMRLLIDESKKRLPNYTIALEVRVFNKRAISCYRNIGFQIKDIYIKDVSKDKVEVIYMEYVEN